MDNDLRKSGNQRIARGTWTKELNTINQARKKKKIMGKKNTLLDERNMLGH